MLDDLSSIGGLADKYVRALNRRHVTGLRELAQSDPDASRQPGETELDLAEWWTAASFVVVFSQRRADGIWERRVEAERTEVEPERATEVWSGWNAAPVCAWMAGQVDHAGDPPAPIPRLRAWLRGGAGRAGPRARDGLRSGRAP